MEEANILLKVLHDNLMTIFNDDEKSIVLDGKNIDGLDEAALSLLIDKLKNRRNIVLEYVPEYIFEQLSISYDKDESDEKLSNLLDSISLLYKESEWSSVFANLASQIRSALPILENKSNDTSDKRLVGRDKTIANTFLRLGTRPSDYKAYYKSYHKADVTHCDLCGASFIYHFYLSHKGGAHTLNVGGDCIVNFVRKYVPEESANIESIIKDALLETKLAVFAQENEDLPAKVSKFIDFYNETRREYLKLGIHVGHFFGTNDVIDIVNEYRRKKYVSKPKLEIFNNYFEQMESGLFLKKLEIQKEEIDAIRANGKREVIVDRNNEEFKDYIENFVYLHPHKDREPFSIDKPTVLEMERVKYQADQKKLKESRKRKKKK